MENTVEIKVNGEVQPEIVSKVDTEHTIVNNKDTDMPDKTEDSEDAVKADTESQNKSDENIDAVKAADENKETVSEKSKEEENATVENEDVKVEVDENVIDKEEGENEKEKEIDEVKEKDERKEEEEEEQQQRVDTPPPSPPTYDEVEADDTQAEQEREPSPEPEPEREPTPEPEPEPEPERAPTPEPVVTISTPSHKYHPRNCHVKKWPHFQGYGFNLHAEKEKTGQYIGLVDAGSPSEDCDLRKGDRIIEVNGENIEEKTHSEVIQKIKAGGEETTLLVVDPEADEYYKNNGITISSSLPEVIHNTTSQRDAPAMTYTPRSCHVIKWADFNGYGFNLHAEKERGGQYIGKIDDNSPAESAGLREHDRIIEVNGENIENETHQQVIMRIKAGGDETKLLVVDKDADNHYKSRGITVSSSMSETKFLQTTRRTTSSSSAVTNGDSPRTTAPVSQPTRVEPTPAPQAQANGGDFLSMKLSAAEMRAQLQSKRKTDPKNKSNLDFKTKHDIFQKM